MAYIGNFPASTQTVDFKWQSVQTSAFSAVTGKGYFVNTTSGAITVTLPSSANVGDAIAIVDYAGTSATNYITLTSSLKIEGETLDKGLTTNREGVIITYADATQGWVATSGVNSGSQALELIPYSVDFLVIAGGGGSGASATGDPGGGGGAGGYRNSYSTEASGGGGSSETSLPFIVGTTYTITVGAGGSAGSFTNNQAGQGANSVISGSGITTITSIGGGFGGNGAGNGTASSTYIGGSGGSGGGGGYDNGSWGSGGSGTANQGYSGGIQTTQGGGGASASPTSRTGGAGLSSSITGSAITRGVGGTSITTGSTATAGTVNTGNGAGSGWNANGGAGGSGVVILRMPTANYSGTTSGSPTVSTDGTDTILIYNASGSYTA